MNPEPDCSEKKTTVQTPFLKSKIGRSKRDNKFC